MFHFLFLMVDVCLDNFADIENLEEASSLSRLIQWMNPKLVNKKGKDSYYQYRDLLKASRKFLPVAASLKFPPVAASLKFPTVAASRKFLTVAASPTILWVAASPKYPVMAGVNKKTTSMTMQGR